MVVHPAAGNYTGTLVNAVLHHCNLPAVSAEAGTSTPASLDGIRQLAGSAVNEQAADDSAARKRAAAKKAGRIDAWGGYAVPPGWRGDVLDGRPVRPGVTQVLSMSELTELAGRASQGYAFPRQAPAGPALDQADLAGGSAASRTNIVVVPTEEDLQTSASDSRPEAVEADADTNTAASTSTTSTTSSQANTHASSSGQAIRLTDQAAVFSEADLQAAVPREERGASRRPPGLWPEGDVGEFDLHSSVALAGETDVLWGSGWDEESEELVSEPEPALRRPVARRRRRRRGLPGTNEQEWVPAQWQDRDDDDLLVLNTGTAAWKQQQAGAPLMTTASEGGLVVLRPGIVHRLDKGAACCAHICTFNSSMMRTLHLFRYAEMLRCAQGQLGSWWYAEMTRHCSMLESSFVLARCAFIPSPASAFLAAGVCPAITCANNLRGWQSAGGASVML